ncbi:MAG TPA: histidinol-phosphate transaminase [Acetivibrio sp.]|uniref:histidinol-phosphate transaminase n=1 Tax=Acetivibrio sp. TaxID=1872092 RepID=UPI002C65BB17|nr:histidinol-phosphate transaminase [Acetivibrio sp.]HOM02364.1 histidinol-phosphate transaminase [Acetivibrio sp.]
MIGDLVRPELQKLVPYVSHQIPYRIKLDANESPFELPESIRKKLADYFLKGPGLNIYPDNESVELRKTLAKYWNVNPDEVVVGTGSNQLIQLIITVFVGKGEKVVYPWPSFSMYKINTLIAGGEPVGVLLDKDKDFGFDTDNFIAAVKEERAKVAFLCNPNNPTGGMISSEDIERILKECSNSIIVVDEAYAEFCNESVIPLVKKYENLVVLRTFSKAYLLAGARCGYSISGPEIANEINKIRPTYNVSSLTQLIAQMVFEKQEEMQKMIQYLINQRGELEAGLKKIKDVYIYPSCANYVLIKVPKADEISKELEKRGILVRSFPGDPVLYDCIRITVGTKEENDIFLEEFSDIINNF